MKKIREYAEFFGVSLVDAYFDLVDMGEITENEETLKYCRGVDRRAGHPDTFNVESR